MFVDRLNLGLILAAGLTGLAVGCSRGENSTAEKPARKTLAKARVVEKKTSAVEFEDESHRARENKKAADRFALPAGGASELLTFIHETIKLRPSRDELDEFRQKAIPAIKKAAEKIKQIATEADKKLPGYEDVDGLLLCFRALDARNATPEEQGQLLDDLKQNFTANARPSKYALSAAGQLASALEHGRNPADAIVVNRELGALLAANSDPQIARHGLKMEGAARRLELPGHAIEITGTKIDGTPFDWSNYRGQVVLVDFWATWCSPCLSELPNLKRNYERYHDKGFEVVGISLDDNRRRLENFIADEQLPWTTLFEAGGWETPLAIYYGISSIPRAILVDRDGTVISIQARGNELDERLAQLFGPRGKARTEVKTSDAPAAAATSD
jgi:thiol-disulfide isomerase/thioredoxin